MATTAERLRYLIDNKGLKQVDILRLAEPYCKKYMVKLNKSDLSQFISGKVSPGRFKLRVLALALNVREDWLWGADVPMEKTATDSDGPSLGDTNYSNLTDKNKVIVDQLIASLLASQSDD